MNSNRILYLFVEQYYCVAFDESFGIMKHLVFSCNFKALYVTVFIGSV